MTKINLAQHKDHFRSEADYKAVVSLLGSLRTNGHTATLWDDEQLLVTVVASPDAKPTTQEHFLKRVMEEPKILDELTDRIENPRPVKWEL